MCGISPVELKLKNGIVDMDIVSHVFEELLGTNNVTVDELAVTENITINMFTLCVGMFLNQNVCFEENCWNVFRKYFH